MFASWHQKENKEKLKNFFKKFLKKTRKIFHRENLFSMLIQRLASSFLFYSLKVYVIYFLHFSDTTVYYFVFIRVSASMEVFQVYSNVDIGNKLDYFGSYGKCIYLIEIVNKFYSIFSNKILNCFFFQRFSSHFNIYGLSLLTTALFSSSYECYGIHNFFLNYLFSMYL